ncbi:MAG TPA: PAS domain-containing sensor histidine kinase [Casimicrobiaceae bacterium]|nr:PAS domain-containing sensor histidine kinase [Casimicrobiaceae bacterium]
MTAPTRREPHASRDASRSAATQLLAVFGPILGLTLFTVVLALIAAWAEWYRTEMLAIAAGMSAVVLLIATFLLYRQAVAKVAAQFALRDSDARVASIVESAMDPIVAVDEHQRIVLFNAAAEKAFGWTSAQVIGRPLELLIPERFHSVHHNHVTRFGATGVTSRRMGERMVLAALRSTGEEFPIDASISQHSEGEHKVFNVILRDVSQRVRAEAELRRSRDELRELATAAHKAREQEQSRIARELHDELGQSLTALKMIAASARQNLVSSDSATAGKLLKIEALLDDTVASARRIASDLRPLMLDDLGLFPAVEWLTEDFSQRHDVACRLDVEDPELRLPSAHESAVFRIVQESLTNVARHSRAKHVVVKVAREDSTLAVTVSDDGIGFATDAPRGANSRGLLGMRERAHLLGGQIHVTSGPGRGTIVEVRLPIEPEAPRP